MPRAGIISGPTVFVSEGKREGRKVPKTYCCPFLCGEKPQVRHVNAEDVIVIKCEGPAGEQNRNAMTPEYFDFWRDQFCGNHPGWMDCYHAKMMLKYYGGEDEN